MSDISEFEKIHSYVTWPDREREFFPNGNVTLGALGFPEANESGVANDGTCGCADGSDGCEMPRKVEVGFSIGRDGNLLDGITYFKSTTHVDVDADDTSVILYLPVKKLDYDLDNQVLTLRMFDDVTALGIGTDSVATLVKYAGSYDPLTTTGLLTGDNLTASGDTLTATVDGPTNDFDLPSLAADDIDSSKFAVKVSVETTSSNVYVYLSNQDGGLPNGVYAICNGTIASVGASVGDDEMSESATEELLNDGKTMDNVGTCCGLHFRKTYSHDEIHDYVYDKVGSSIGFGVHSDVAGCQGGFIDWFVSNGLVDIGNRHGYSVYVNGFGLGSFYVGSSAVSLGRTKRTEHVDEVETYHPWLLWSYGTTRDERTDANISALPRDWPFTYDNNAYSDVDDVSMVTLVKHGVRLNDPSDPEFANTTYGNLYQDIHEDNDPSKPVVAHCFYNKHHFVLNQKYVRGENGGYEVKPFFIQLPAPLDTEDGETYEITVSIQNQQEDSLPLFTNRRDLSAYYAAMSQPRVYVMGGRQQFSNKKMPVRVIQVAGVAKCDIQVDKNSGTYVVNTTKPAYDAFGELLHVGTEVRANIVTMLDGKTLPSFMAYGILDENDESGATLTFNGSLPSDRRYQASGARMYICGMAYLSENDNPSDVRMGLVRGRDDGGADLFRGDTGSGVLGALDEFNNFYSISEKDGHRSLPHLDRRYFLASVYQTATNTFPWRMSGRKKLRRLDRVETDITASVDHIVHRMFTANREFIWNSDFSDITQGENEREQLTYFKLAAVHSPVTYGSGNFTWKNLASVLRVGLPPYLSTRSVTAVTEPFGNPVRQAADAMRNFVNDMFNARLVLKTGQSNSEVATKYLSIRDRDAWPQGGDTLFSSADIDYGSLSNGTTRSQIAHCALRTLPDYVVNADLYDVANPLHPTTSDSVLFTEAGDGNGHGAGFFDYFDESPYAKYPADPFASSAATGENDCDVVGEPVTGRDFGMNSVFRALMKTLNTTSQRLVDLRRRADVAILIQLNSEIASLSSDIEWFRPFTNLSYKDGAPAVDYSSADAISEQQRQFFAFDAVQMYRFMMDDENDPVATVSTRMPYLSSGDREATERSKALASFVEKYVTSCGAEMPTHFYKGRRVQLKNGVMPDGTQAGPDRLIYVNELYRVRKRYEADGCGAADLSAFVTHYFNDNFSSTTSDSRNPNADYAKVDGYSLTANVPPYSEPYEYTNGNTYTRVRMQFTFSQRAGRWYTTEYRQYPCSYLSPLYGNDALIQTERSIYDEAGNVGLASVGGEATSAELPIWRNSACVGFRNYRNVMYVPYSSYPAMDISLGCVPYLFNEWPYDEHGRLDKKLDSSVDVITEGKPYLKKLEEPWLDYQRGWTGGISLYPPANIDGGHEPATDAGVHANFWSVREFLRPATSILPGTHIPKYEDPDTYDENETYHYRQGGLESDPTLYRMFDFPKAGVTQYHLPRPSEPSDDMSNTYLMYRGLSGDMTKEGVMKSSGGFWFGYVVPDSAQNINNN